MSDQEKNTEELLEQIELQELLYGLREEHRDLDAAIHAMSQNPFTDQLRLRRMKLRKLKLKDEIGCIESELIPDLDA